MAMSGRAGSWFLGGAAILMATPVHAQQQPAVEGARPASGATADAAPGSGEVQSDDGQTGEIIVSAQRRDERARDVPITLTVLSAGSLEAAGVDKLRDLHVVTPGLRIDRNGVSVQPSIRGVTALDGNPGNDANVAIYVDGVYQPNPAANNLDLPDIDRIEVLKGPQGTLFGRNATGGAIRIETRKPSFDPTGDFSASYGSFDDVTLKGFISGPVAGDVVAASLTGYYETSDGYLRDLTNGGRATGGLDTKLVRGKILIKPASDLSILLTGQYQNRSDRSLTGQPFAGNTAARGTPGVIIPTRAWDVANNYDPRVDIEQYAFSGNVDLDVGFATITSITAYNNVRQYSPVEGDYTNVDLSFFYTTLVQNTFSQELNLASNNSGSLKWIVGGFYYRDRARYDPLAVRPPATLFNIYSGQNTNAYAVFGEVTYDITSRLTAIAGLRYSHEKRMLTGRFGVREFPQLADKTFTSTTPRLTLRYALTDDTNVYATYSQGFKSGGFTASALRTTPFNPEKVKAWEAGIKSAPDRTLSVNAAGFYYDYTNQQVQAAITLPGGATVGVTTNAASSRIYGAEFDATIRPSPAFSVNTAVSLLHARYRSFPTAFVQQPILLGGVACRCGNQAQVVDASGNQLVRAPDYTVSVTPRYRRELGAGTIDLSGTLYFSDRFFFTPDNRVGQPAYATLSARASFEPAGLPIQLSVWGRNLTNTVVYQGASILPGADGVLFAPRRAYGVEGRFHF